MTVYLLCFDRPYKHARHYLGWAPDGRLWARLAAHAAGHGSVLTGRAAAAGVVFRLARTWPGGRAEERRLKRRPRGSWKLSESCPVCHDMPRIERWAGGGRQLAARYARHQAAARARAA